MNIAAILRYCPKGTKLYSLVDGEVTFVKVLNIEPYSIEVVLNDGTIKFYTEDGLYFANHPNGECVLFPSKDQRDWNKFRIPKIKVMNRQQAKELLPIIQAFAEGKEIEYRIKGFQENWKKMKELPIIAFGAYEYRIKPVIQSIENEDYFTSYFSVNGGYRL